MSKHSKPQSVRRQPLVLIKINSKIIPLEFEVRLSLVTIGQPDADYTGEVMKSLIHRAPEAALVKQGTTGDGTAICGN